MPSARATRRLRSRSSTKRTVAGSSTAERHDLGKVDLLRGLDPAERTRLEERCVWRRYRMGERVFERGSAGREVFFVVEGALNIVSFSPIGREVTFATAPAGATVGELAAIDGLPRSASVVAIEDSLLAVLDAESFVALIKAHGELAFELLCRLSTVVRKGDERVLEIGNLQATGRVYLELLRLAEPDEAAPDLWVVKPLPPLRELAGTAGTTREIVSGALKQLYPSGVIRRKGDALYILDRAALEAIIEPDENAAGA